MSRSRHPDFAHLAAAYGIGLASQVDATLAMLGVAAGDIDEPAFASWMRGHARKV